MNKNRILPIALLIVAVILAWQVLAVILANLPILLLLGAVGAVCRYWGTGITPGHDLHRLTSRRKNSEIERRRW